MNVCGLARRVGIVVCSCHDTFPTCKNTYNILAMYHDEMQFIGLVMAAAHLSCELRLSATIEELYLKWGPL